MAPFCEFLQNNLYIEPRAHVTGPHQDLPTESTASVAELIAELLGVPFVYTLRFSMGDTVEKHCGKLPAPLSYVPVTMAALTDRMTFLQRVKNLMYSIFFKFWIHQHDNPFWDQFYSEVLGK